MANENTAVAKRSAPREIEEVLQSEGAMSMLTPFLPEGVDVKRVVAQAKMAVLKNPDLAKATPASLIVSVAQILSWNLELGDTADILTFKNKKTDADGKDYWEVEAQPNQRYTGQIQLMVATGAVRSVEPEVVYEGDHFVMRKGLNPQLDHIPTSDPSKRGRMIGVYAVVRLPFGAATFHYMSIEEVDAIRTTKSKQWKSGACPPWYAKKCCIRQLAKYVPRNPKLSRAFAVIDEDAKREFGEIAGASAVRRLASGGEEVQDISHMIEDHGQNTRTEGAQGKIPF